MAGGAECERTTKALLGAFQIERECTFARQGEVPDRAALEVFRLCSLTGRASELERCQVVMGEHVGQIFNPLARLPLQPPAAAR